VNGFQIKGYTMMIQSNLLTLSKFKPFFMSILGAVFLTDCEDGSNVLSADYSVSFYDENLDFIETVRMEGGIIKPSDIKSGSWYKAGESLPLKNYNLNGDIRLYAVRNVQEITTQEELNNVRGVLDGKCILLNDIKLDENGAGFEGAEGWGPIGDPFFPFIGIFNGNSHNITNLWINRPSTDYVGFFGGAENAKIRNLEVKIAESKEIKGNFEVGGIAGYIKNSSIINSCLNGNVSGSYDVGGIAGLVYSGSSIVNSFSSGNINGSGEIGGIAGYIGRSVSITNSYSNADISGNGKYIGGIVGDTQNSSVTNSYSAGKVSGYECVGGIAGTIDDITIIKNNAALNLSVMGTNYYGCVIGCVDGIGIISNNFARSALALEFDDFTENNADLGIGKIDNEFRKRDIYEICLGWRFGDEDNSPWVWNMFDDYLYPTLYWQTQKP
jgi:hypothetical protein